MDTQFSSIGANEVRRNKIKERIDKIIVYILLLLIGLAPLIVFATGKEFQSPYIYRWTGLNSGYQGDLFTYFKFLFLVIATAIIFVLFCVKVFYSKYTIKKGKINIVIFLSMLAVLASIWLSPTIDIAFIGKFNRTEGGLSWFCYLLLFFIVLNIDLPKNIVHKIFIALTPFTIINFIIGLCSLYGYNLLDINLIKRFITIFMNPDAKLSEGSTIVGTLNQWNYLSGIFAVITTMFLAGTIFTEYRKYYFTMAIIAWITVLMNISTIGFLVVILMMVVIYILSFFYGKHKIAAPYLVLFLILTLPIVHIFSLEKPRIFSDTIGFMLDDNPYRAMVEVETPDPVVDISKIDAGEATLTLPQLHEQGDSALSSRVYIWDKTLDLIMEKPMFGYGIDTLAYQFPHFNIDARSGIGSERLIVDKPHSFYFGLLYGVGIVGTVLILVLFTVVILKMAKVTIRKELTPVLFLALGVIAYLLQGVTNDTVQGTTVIIWIILGVTYNQLNNSKTTVEETTVHNKQVNNVKGKPSIK